MNLLELKSVVKSFTKPSGQGRLEVLRGIDLCLSHGDSIAMVGPSGSGKSTLLNIIGTLDQPSSGEVILEGRRLAFLAEEKLARIRNQDIGFVFQLHHLLPQCTVIENVLIPTLARWSLPNGHDRQRRAEALLTRVGLENHFDYFPARLSGGELQRVAVVRALINKPKLVLADEPTGSLDRDSATELGRLLLELNREEGTALIVATHSMELASTMESIYALHNGLLERSNPRLAGVCP